MKRLALIAVVLLPLLLSAQSTTQSIQGLVTDPSGAVIAGAKVTMINPATGVSQTVLTNATGNYTFVLVPVGLYDLKFEMQGFKTETIRGLRVETAAQVRQDAALQVGAVTETVEVSAQAVLLSTENATVGGVVGNQQIVNMPLIGRNVVQLAVLVPGVQFGERTGRGDGMGGFPIPGQGFSVSANGQREIHQVVSLDGVDAKDPRIHITNFVPSIEAIEEFKILTNAYTAEIGFGGGAQVAITMKSGTNSFHGTLFEFLRNDKLDAEHYFLNFNLPSGRARNKKDALRRNNFGTVVSGPLLLPKIYDGRNRTFWAFNFESRIERVERVQTATFPLDTFRRGDFSEILQPTINAATGLPRNPIVVFDPLTGDPFPNNVIPQSRLHRGALSVIEQFLPRADFRQIDPLDFTNRRGVNIPVDAHQFFGRVDHYFSQSDRVFARLAVDRSSTENNIINPHFPVLTDSRVTNLATQWVHMFNQNTINEFRVGFNISNDTLNTLHNNESFDIDSLGIGQYRVVTDGNRRLTPREQGVPIMGFTIGERINGNGQDQMDTIQIGNHLSLVRGKHNLKFGGEMYKITMERSAANLAQGRLTFSINETGYDFASLLLGYPNRAETPEGEPFTFPRADRYAGYFHDDWKVTPKLTVNLGLRFDYNGVPIDAQGLWRTFDFVGLGADVGRGQGFRAPDGQTIPTMFPNSVDEKGAVKLFKQDVKFFMPRVGIAYRPWNKWVFRAGAGWYDNINHVNTWTILNLNPPKSGVQEFNSVVDTLPSGTRRFRPGSPVITLDDPFLTRAGVQAAARPINTVHIPPDTKDGDVWKWSFDIQHELPFQTALTIGYAGSKGTHVGNSIGNFNDALPSADTNFQARRPFQRFFDPPTPERGIQTVANIRYVDSYGESFYHGLQAKLDKRFSRGLSFGLAYTLSKAHGDGENGGQEGAGFQNPRDRVGSRGLFRFDQRHNFVSHFLWELPGSGLRGALKHIVGGWQANGGVTMRSGFPYTLGQAASDLNVGAGPVRPDRLRSGELDNPTRKLWYDPSAFQRVTCRVPSRLDLCHYGNAGYNILRAPSQRDVGLALFKNFLIREGVRLQFRAEAANAFNTPYFGDPRGLGFTTLQTLVPDSPRVGEIESLRTSMRIIQLGLKLHF